MTVQRLTTSQVIERPIDEVFAFFAEPRNLRRITPAGLGFEFLSNDFDMRVGLEIDYRLRPLLGIPTLWRTRIEAYRPPYEFADIQLQGPYRSWRHHHTFKSVEGGTLAEDEITYELLFGPIGSLGNALLVRNELEQIFRHRAHVIERVFEQAAPNDAPRTIAVAGGTGFVGSAIARELHRRGDKVIVLSHSGEAARAGLPDAIEIRQADVMKRDGNLETALAGVEQLVISLAFPNLPVEAPRRGFTFQNVDAGGTERLVDAAQVANVKRLVYMSGAGAAADSPRRWFRAKWRAEQAVRASGLDWTIVRPTWIYGPDDVSLNRFMGFARRLPIVPLSNFGRQQMAPVFIDDVARLVADSLAADEARNQVFEIGGPETMSMRAVIARALRVADLKRPIVPAPAWLVKLAVAPLVVLPQPPLTPAAIDFINQPAAVDVGPLLARMPRRLTPFEEGLATYLRPSSGPGQIHFESAATTEAGIHSIHGAKI